MLTRKQFLSVLGGAVLIGCHKGGTDEPPGEPTVDAPPGHIPSVDAPAAPSDASTSDGSMTDAAAASCNSTTVTIGTNHGHTAHIHAADVNAGVEKSYDITGTSDHPHTVTITAAMFEMMRAGNTVTVTSTNDASHTHTVTLRCV